MATIQTSIQLVDGMSPALRSMQKALNLTLSTFVSMQEAAGKPIDAASIQAARNEITKAGLQLNKVERDIQKNKEAQDKFNKSVKDGGGAVSSLAGKIKTMIGAYVGYQTAMGIADTSDELTNTTARLHLMNDGLQTTEQLSDKIYEAAQRSRGAYFSTADAVAKMGLRAGSIFKSNDETIAFVETLNKMFVVAGASQAEISSATLQLTQALGSGVLRGEEFNAVFESAPNVMQAVADYIGKPIGALREMAANGEITAETVKNALFAASEKVNEQFATMPVTFSQAGTIMKNKFLDASKPILQALSDITSSERFIKFADGVGAAVEKIVGFFQRVGNVVMPILGDIYDKLSSVFNFFSENWSVFEPIVWGIVTAMAAYKGVLMAVATWTSIVGVVTSTVKGVKILLATATWALTGATKAQAAAQWGLNAAMLANPVGVVIIAVIALVAIFYAAIAVINKFAGTSYSATGMICGAFMWLGAAIANQWIRIWNVGYGVIKWLKQGWQWLSDNIGKMVNNIGVWWDNLCIDMYSMFGKLIVKLLDKLASFLGKFQTVADYVGIDLGFQGILEAAKTAVSAGVDGLQANKKQLEKLTEFNPNVNWNHTDVFDLTEAYNKGYQWGEEKAAKLEELVKGLNPEEKIEELRKLEEQVNSESNKYNSGMGDIGKALSGQLGDNPALDAISKNTGDISNSLENIDKNISVSDDEMNYIRNLANREAIDRATRGDVTVNITNNNQIKDGMDVESVAKELAKKVHDEIQANSDGVRY